MYLYRVQLELYLNHRNMEKSDSNFTVSPKNILLNEGEDIIRFNVKNISNKSCHYQMFVPDYEHFKIFGNRTFTIAPGITKNIKIQHCNTSQCSALNSKIEISDSFGNRNYVYFKCFQQKVNEVKLVQLPELLKLQKLKVNQQKLLQIPVKNLSQVNLRVKAYYTLPNFVADKISLNMQEDQMILLKGTTKMFRLRLKILKQAEIECNIGIQFVKEESKFKWVQQIRISCNSLQRSQYIADNNLNRIDYIQHEMLNGTSTKGSLTLVNNYHESCPFKLLEIMEIDNYKAYCERLEQITLKLEQTQGVIAAKSQKKIHYQIFTKPNENDKNFTTRYAQLQPKDEVNAYKLRNSNFFRKNKQFLLKIQFGMDNANFCKLRTHIINPALRLTKTSSKNVEIIEIANDTNIQIPFKINNNLYFNASITKGKLKCGVNSLQIQWRKIESTMVSKENVADILKCMVKMQLPENQIIIYQPVNLLKRPKTALQRCESANLLSRSQLRQKITQRAPTKLGDVGIKAFKEVSAVDFTEKPNKYIKSQVLLEQEFKYLQISQNEKGNVITNSHPEKNLIAYFPDRGYLLLQSQHSYLLNYEKKGLKFELCGKGFEVKNKQVEDNQVYKIVKKELLFCFAQHQKQFEVIRQIQIVNKSNLFLMVYCLSIEDQFFHSLQKDNKILISPKSTNFYKISFCPSSQRKVKQRKILRQLQFLIGQQKQVITCQGDFLPADVNFDEKSITFNNCLYSQNQINKTLIIFNSGLNKVSYQIQHSQFIKVNPKSSTIPEKGKQSLTFSFCPSKLSKKYDQEIKVWIKGSHIIKIPFHVNTLQPDIYCQQETLDFGQGYINETLTSFITIKNQNSYSCKLNLHLDQVPIKGDKKITVQGKTSKRHELKLMVREVGQKLQVLPTNFLQLEGYGIIKGPKQIRIVGKKTILQLVPDNPLKDLICSQVQENKTFQIKNISHNKTDISLVLTNIKKQRLVILSCQPTNAQLYPGEQKQFILHSIRADQDSISTQSRYIEYNLSIYFTKGILYRSLDFNVCLPPPELQITPQEVYFPLVSIGVWSKSTFTIRNKGYKQVFIAIKKPANIIFELDYEFQKKQNRLSKLKNTCEVTVLFKSKKPISFRVILQIENNFGQKYEVKLNGTTSKSPLLNCDRSIGSSIRGFSSRQIKTTTQSSLKTISGCESTNQQTQNIRFFSRWIHGLFPQSIKDNQYFFVWLKHPKNLLTFLHFINAGISNPNKQEMNLNFILEQLKKIGYPLYTLQKDKLIQCNPNEWTMFLWFVLSKDLLIEDCLKWVNKTCGINLQTYQNAFNHHKKVQVDLLSRLLQPLFKYRLTEWSKIVQFLQPSIPILSKIDNKRQFALLLNILYNKFSKIEKRPAYTTNLTYEIKFHSGSFKENKTCWILGNNPFQYQLKGDCKHQKYAPEKKMLYFSYEGEVSVNIKIKQDLTIMAWNNSFYEPIKIIDLMISKKPPISHNIVIECEDKCTQEWKLEFVCQIESEYFFQFSGGMEFKCKMPDVGVIQAGEIMQFRVLYSPTNLKEHQGVLKICNKYEEHIYNLKGKPLRSNFIQIQKTIKIPQGQRWIQTFSIPEENVNSQHSVYRIQQIGAKTQELKTCEAKSNKKQIILKIELQFYQIVQNKQLILRVTSNDSTFCRNIRLIINVIPKPILVEAQLRGIVEKVVVQRIPLTNSLAVKQSCFITIHKLTKEQFLNFKIQNIDLEAEVQSQKAQSEFKLSHIDKVNLKPNQTIKMQLSYLPFTLNESFCQIRVKYDLTEEIVIYNFMGIPELSCNDNPLTTIQCEIQKQSTHTIKIPNKLKEKINFDVETSIKFIAGPDQITLQPRQTFYYSFKLLPLHPGQYFGQLLFKSQKLNLSYPLKVNVTQNKKIRKIRVLSKIRVTSTLQIKLNNKSDKEVQYDVCCNSQYISFDPKLVIPPNSQKQLMLHFTPLFIGTKNAQIKLFNEKMQEICYHLQMVSQNHKQSYKFNCELGEKKKIKIVLKNPTAINAKVLEPKLPIFLTSNHQAFPLNLPAYSNTVLELIYTQIKLTDQQSCQIQIQTDSIGQYSYDLTFHISNEKIMPSTVISYDFHQVGQQITKEFYLQIFNSFDQIVNYTIQSKKIQYNKSIWMKTDDEKFTLKPYGTKHLKFITNISTYDLTQKDWQLEALNNKINIVTGNFKLVFPLKIIQIHTMKSKIEINGSCHQLARTRVSLRHVKNLKNWQINNFPDYKEIMNIAYLSSKDVYLEVIINKTCDYNGEVTFYDEDMICAEKYPLHIKISGKKIETVNIAANVGQKGRVDMRIKNGKGKFHVELKNNKQKEFDVVPRQGQFSDKGDNLVRFEYNPVQYNGFKKAEATIYSDSGIFSFLLVGKFPNHK